MTWVELRCDRHQWARLDPDAAIIQVRCTRCEDDSCEGYHYFDATTGAALPLAPAILLSGTIEREGPRGEVRQAEANKKR